METQQQQPKIVPMSGRREAFELEMEIAQLRRQRDLSRETVRAARAELEARARRLARQCQATGVMAALTAILAAALAAALVL